MPVNLQRVFTNSGKPARNIIDANEIPTRVDYTPHITPPTRPTVPYNLLSGKLKASL